MDPRRTIVFMDFEALFNSWLVAYVLNLVLSHIATVLMRNDCQQFVQTMSALAFSIISPSSPLWYISIMISDPPMNSPHLNCYLKKRKNEQRMLVHRMLRK